MRIALQAFRADKRLVPDIVRQLDHYRGAEPAATINLKIRLGLLATAKVNTLPGLATVQAVKTDTTTHQRLLNSDAVD